MPVQDTQAWFDRKFDVPYPAALLPSVLVRLRGTPGRLEELLRGRDRSRLVAKPDGRWSAQEIAGHLLDVEPLWLARVGDFVSGSDRLTAADLTNRKTEEANHNAASLERILTGFRAARESLSSRLEAIEPSWLTRAIPHPRLGTLMKLPDHLHFVAEHDDHHLAQIWSLLEERR